MAKTPGSRNIVSAVRETLDSVVTPSVRDKILARALAAVKRQELPTDLHDLEEFLHGALHDSLVKALGPELGLSVSSELERITAMAGRDAKPRSEPPARKRSDPPERKADTVRPGKSLPTVGRRKQSRSTMPSTDNVPIPPGSVARTDERWVEKERRGIAPTLPAARRTSLAGMPGEKKVESAQPSKGGPFPVSNDYPRGVAQALGMTGTASVDPRPSQRPAVLLASSDPEMLRLFQTWLEMRAQVEPAAGVTALLARLTQIGGPRTVIVLDGRSPSIRPLTLAALADELPPGTTVLLWGVQAHLHARMCTISAAAEKWSVHAGDTTTNEIVAECARIVG